MKCIWCADESNVAEIRVGCGSYTCVDVCACNRRSAVKVS